MNYTRQLLETPVQSPFAGNIWGADLADMKLISKFNNLILCVIEIYCKYVWAISLKDKKGITITNPFQKIVKNLIASQMKYGLIKAGNFIITQWNQS